MKAVERAVRAEVTKKRTGRQPLDDGHILDLVGKSQGLTCDEIAAAIGKKTDNTWQKLKRLERDGKVVQGGDRKWRKAVATAASVN